MGNVRDRNQLHFSPYLPEHVSYWSHFVDISTTKKGRLYRPTGGPNEDNRKYMSFVCDDHGFTTAEPQSVPQSY